MRFQLTIDCDGTAAECRDDVAARLAIRNARNVVAKVED
jgi:hypothetical protein